MSDFSAAAKIEDISPVKLKLSFDIPWADVKDELDAVYRKVSKKAKVKGFRPGKIPREILEMYYQHEAEDETVANLVNRYYWGTVQEKNISAVTQPQVEQNGIERDKNFTFSATVEVEPTIVPRDYVGLELEKAEPIVTEDELSARLQEIRQMFATMEEVKEDRAMVLGDFANLDFAGTLAGESLKELKSENYLLELGSKTFVPGFEDQLVGMKKGETKVVAVTFPGDYHAANLAGKAVEFSVKINGLHVKKVPEIDDNFIKNFERYESLEALKDDVRKNLEEEKKHKVEAEFERQIGDKLLQKNDFEVPESFTERQIYYMISDTQRRMVAGGMDPRRAREFSLKLKDQFRDEAKKIVKTILLLKSIAQQENITVTADDLEEQIRKIAAQKGLDYESMKKTLEKDDMIENIQSEIVTRKTYEFLERNAKVIKSGNDKAAEE